MCNTFDSLHSWPSGKIEPSVPSRSSSSRVIVHSVVSLVSGAGRQEMIVESQSLVHERGSVFGIDFGSHLKLDVIAYVTCSVNRGGDGKHIRTWSWNAENITIDIQMSTYLDYSRETSGMKKGCGSSFITGFALSVGGRSANARKHRLVARLCPAACMRTNSVFVYLSLIHI